ncbi:hypothetical protein [Arthrobacter cryoconiti]|uniref:Uncharacterized protein n=1 Tax=Arthrobacter cryoconiti TaxID=748907 RepID=A0ABV8QY21_9MICC|nr:hypothetical protein [Arthrobacter cryoconiti]MCC9067315.1 hypothetical protein [Arthrobacter cryoconiti]
MIGRFMGGLFGGDPIPQVQVSAQVPGSPQASTAEQEIAEMSSSADRLRASVLRSGSQLPPLLTSQLRHLGDLMHQAVIDIGVHGSSTEQRVLLNTMICSYVPTPLQTYLSLQPAHHEEKSRATFMLAEQLATLEETLTDLLNQIRIGAVEELSTHGRFLADKFASQDAALRLEHTPENHGQEGFVSAPQPLVERDPLRLEGQPWRR